MITPYSQFVVTPVAINVATGERYKHVIDDLIVFAKGAYAGDRLLGMRRAKALVARERPDVPLEQIRAKLGGPGVSDDEFLLRYIMKGADEIEAMQAAGPRRQYFSTAMPLLTLIRELGKHGRVRYIQVRRGSDSLLVQNRNAG